VPQGVSRCVDDIPAVPSDEQFLATPQALRGLDHGVQVRQPARQVIGEVRALGLGDPMVGIGVPASRTSRVGMTVLLAVEVGEGVHGQLGTGGLHEPAGQAVVVDVGVRDHDAGDVPERISRRLDPRLDGRESPVRQVRSPHAAVDERDPVAVTEDVHVHGVDCVDTHGQRHPRQTVEAGGIDTDVGRRLGRHPAHPCMRSSSVNQTRSCTS
jgi:hypothetical protein